MDLTMPIILKNGVIMNWKGGRKIHSKGYVQLLIKNHPRSDANGYVYEHIVIAERVLGKSLPLSALPHHVNENRADNRPNNLVICQNDTYHKLIHKRMRALRACGNVHWLKCKYCKRYGPPEKMYVEKNGKGYHKSCKNQIDGQRYARTKAERLCIFAASTQEPPGGLR